jgi:hypothetical protein
MFRRAQCTNTCSSKLKTQKQLACLKLVKLDLWFTVYSVNCRSSLHRKCLQWAALSKSYNIALRRTYSNNKHTKRSKIIRIKSEIRWETKIRMSIYAGLTESVLYFTPHYTTTDSVGESELFHVAKQKDCSFSSVQLCGYIVFLCFLRMSCFESIIQRGSCWEREKKFRYFWREIKLWVEQAEKASFGICMDFPLRSASSHGLLTEHIIVIVELNWLLTKSHVVHYYTVLFPHECESTKRSRKNDWLWQGR